VRFDRQTAAAAHNGVHPVTQSCAACCRSGTGPPTPLRTGRNAPRSPSGTDPDWSGSTPSASGKSTLDIHETFCAGTPMVSVS